MTLSQQQPPLVSVIIPVYNGARFLAGAISGVLAQGYSPLEIIVVDDGSTDETAQIAAQFGDPVRYVYQERRGSFAARNRALGIAQGEIIAFLDADDEWPPGKLRRQVGYLQTHPAVAIVQGLIVQKQLDRAAPESELVFEECSEPYQFINLGSAVYRRAAFDEVGPFEEQLSDNADTDWFLRAWEKNVVKVVQDQVALFYRLHDTNITNTQQPPNLRIVKVFKRHLDRLRHEGRVAGAGGPAMPTIGQYIGTAPAVPGRATVRDEDFTIISNDCWGSGPYNHLRLLYGTPFIGTRILAPCYIELLQNLESYLHAPLEFIASSRYDFINERRASSLGYYPIALLYGKVELHFVHESTPDAASQKWLRRRTKMNLDNLFIKLSQDPEVCDDALLQQFDCLNYPYKVCFTLRDYPALRSTIPMPDYFADAAPMYFLSRRYFDTLAWLDKRYGPDTQLYRLAAATAVADPQHA